MSSRTFSAIVIWGYEYKNKKKRGRNIRARKIALAKYEEVAGVNWWGPERQPAGILISMEKDPALDGRGRKTWFCLYCI